MRRAAPPVSIRYRSVRLPRFGFSKAFSLWSGLALSDSDRRLIDELELRRRHRIPGPVVLDQRHVSLPLLALWLRFVDDRTLVVARDRSAARAFMPGAVAHAGLHRPDSLRGYGYIRCAVFLDADLAGCRGGVRRFDRVMRAIAPYIAPGGLLIVLGDPSRHPRGSFAGYLRAHPFTFHSPPVLLLPVLIRAGTAPRAPSPPLPHPALYTPLCALSA